jgi:hypothetical protein
MSDLSAAADMTTTIASQVSILLTMASVQRSPVVIW